MKTKVLLRVKVKDPKSKVEHVRCTVKQSADTGYVRIEGGIDWWNNNAAQFRAAIDALKNAGINILDVYVNTPGGSVFEAREIANIIDSWKGKKSLTLGALCCSAGTELILPFPKDNVKAYSNITAMMHNPTISIFDAEEKDLLSNAKLLSNTKKTYVQKMSARTGLSETQLSNKLDGTWWMTYQDLLDYNLVSGKIEAEDKIPQDAANVFNAYRFENVPVVLNKALGIELLDEPEETEPANSGGAPNPLKTTMKNLIQLLMVSLVALKNKLTETSSEAEVVAAITNAFTEKENKIAELTQSLKDEQAKVTKLQTEVDNNAANMIKARLDMAEKTEKKITPEQRKVFEDQVKNKVLNFENLDALITAMPVRQSIKNALNSNGGTPPANGGKQEDQREEPEFSKDENGGRVYNKSGEGNSQQAILMRMMIANKKA